ncbi:MAG: diacylglycerol kinase family lipid kinase [Calditrichaeota bacterium]|nr:MAG: diacylglycerol kinase family lipid kinase [Calditrichota bacterium]
MSVCIILNPISGYKFKRKRIQSYLKQLSPDIPVWETHYAGQAAEYARQALQQGYRRIIAVGGDGTVNEIAAQLTRKEAALGIVAAGSGNGLARSLGLPLSVEQAFHTALNGREHRMDVGSVNDRYFFAVTGVGIDARIGQRFQKLKHRGILPYFIQGVRAYLEYDYPSCTIKTDPPQSLPANRRPLTIVVANGTEFGNGAQIAPRALIDDGWLDLCILNKMCFTQVVGALPALFSGAIDSKKSYNTFRVKTVVITPQTVPFVYHVDGEPVISHEPLHISIMPKALKVIV